jgi:response regulator RpfG family c-di-GMP phosphodiesterase
MTNRRILCVDDDTNILEAFAQNLRDRFEVFTAENAADGLQLMNAESPFAVVMSDLRMPHMDGTVFLSKVQRLAPDTTRILLTGQGDMEAAIEAVNRGGIFRLLCKPCPRDVLAGALEDAVEQHRNGVFEREQLEQTVAGLLKMLSEIMGMVAPTLFAQASRLRECVLHMVNRLGLGDPWQYDVAAMLSQIGLISVPNDVVERAFAGKNLTEGERRLMDDHPAVGYGLLAAIPKLDRVAAMIRDQRAPQPTAIAPVVLGANMLRIAAELDGMLSRGLTCAEALRGLVYHGCDRHLVAALKDYRPTAEPTRTRALNVAQLRPGMVLDEDIRVPSGTIVITKGSALTAFSVERLKKFAQTIGLPEQINIRSAKRKNTRQVATHSAAPAPALFFGTKGTSAGGK